MSDESDAIDEGATQITVALEDIGSALKQTLISPNCFDSNLEAANVVDGLYAIARAIQALALAIDNLALKEDE
jgi:hypothetical protein